MVTGLDISGNATIYLGRRSRGWRGSNGGMGKLDDEGQKAQEIKQSPIPRQPNPKMVQTHMSSTCSNKSEMRSFYASALKKENKREKEKRD